jgi:hypothetical protein
LLHCAAGIHRTGTLAYTLLRLSGLSENQSIEGLKTMREETWKGVGAWRIELAENLLVKFMLVNKEDTLPAIAEEAGHFVGEETKEMVRADKKQTKCRNLPACKVTDCKYHHSTEVCKLGVACTLQNYMLLHEV